MTAGPKDFDELVALCRADFGEQLGADADLAMACVGLAVSAAIGAGMPAQKVRAFVGGLLDALGEARGDEVTS